MIIMIIMIIIVIIIVVTYHTYYHGSGIAFGSPLAPFSLFPLPPFPFPLSPPLIRFPPFPLAPFPFSVPDFHDSMLDRRIFSLLPGSLLAVTVSVGLQGSTRCGTFACGGLARNSPVFHVRSVGRLDGA